MSLEAITWAYRTEVGSPTRKAVLLVLANYADEDDSAFPSHKRIATMTELSVASVRRELDKLQEMGLIAEREKRTRGKDGGDTSNRYTLDLTWEGEGGAQGEQGGCSDTTPPVLTVSTRDTKSNRESDTKQNRRAARRAPSGSDKPKSKGLNRHQTDDDKELERAGSVANDGPPPAKKVTPFRKPRRGWTATTLVGYFHNKSLEAESVPPAARDLIAKGLRTNLEKWISEGTATPDEIAEAMRFFFIDPEARLYGEATLWLAFVNHYATIAQQVARKNNSVPYSEKINVKHTLDAAFGDDA